MDAQTAKGDDVDSAYAFHFPVVSAETYLLSGLDPTKSKDQDHYAIFGLAHVRFQASYEQIKKAYRKLILKHHPDKIQPGEEKSEENYFPCILRAWEALGESFARKSYDSADPISIQHGMDEVPTQIPDTDTNLSQEALFYETFGRATLKNARWSVRETVPLLGGSDTNEDDVSDFYAFWYDFDSWREYSYFDEEEKEKGEDRYERREIDKRNKDMRKQRKKDEMQRLRRLVDNMYASDPRIARFKQQAKQRKEDDRQRRKLEKDERRRVEDEKREAAEEAQRQQRAAEQERERQAAAQVRKEKEAAQRALRKERTLLRRFVEGKQFFDSEGSQYVKRLEELDLLCNVLDVLQLRSFNEAVAASSEPSSLFDDEVNGVRQRLRQENERTTAPAAGRSDTVEGDASAKHWPQEDVRLLVRALRTYPAGTQNRWQVVACFLEQHSKSGVKHTNKDVIARVKQMSSMDTSGASAAAAAAAATAKNDTGSQAFNAFQKDKKVSSAADMGGETATPSARFDRPADFLPERKIPWTPAEQRLLEQALRSYPPTMADRWDRVAETVSTRGKEQCLKRYQAIVAAMRAKKAADRM